MSMHMSPGEVTGAGRQLARTAHEVKAKIRSLFRSSDTASHDNKGWKSSASLDACHRAWEKHLDQLVDNTRQTGQDLITAAGRVSATDQEAADRLRHVLDDLDRRSP